jgi:hypothetical protein
LAEPAVGFVHLFVGVPAPACLDAVDFNDFGTLDIFEAVPHTISIASP